MTRFRIGLGLGLVVGYYLGSRAGRERYHQINRTIYRVRKTKPLHKMKAAVELGRERVRSRGGDETVQLVLVDETDGLVQGSSR
ncbi:MAG: hypothetical protein ACXW1S_00285 [Acidimicrobiia bacterium]